MSAHSCIWSLAVWAIFSMFFGSFPIIPLFSYCLSCLRLVPRLWLPFVCDHCSCSPSHSHGCFFISCAVSPTLGLIAASPVRIHRFPQEKFPELAFSSVQEVENYFSSDSDEDISSVDDARFDSADEHDFDFHYNASLKVQRASTGRSPPPTLLDINHQAILAARQDQSAARQLLSKAQSQAIASKRLAKQAFIGALISDLEGSPFKARAAVPVIGMSPVANAAVVTAVKVLLYTGQDSWCRRNNDKKFYSGTVHVQPPLPAEEAIEVSANRFALLLEEDKEEPSDTVLPPFPRIACEKEVSAIADVEEEYLSEEEWFSGASDSDNSVQFDSHDEIACGFEDAFFIKVKAWKNSKTSNVKRNSSSKAPQWQLRAAAKHAAKHEKVAARQATSAGQNKVRASQRQAKYARAEANVCPEDHIFSPPRSPAARVRVNARIYAAAPKTKVAVPTKDELAGDFLEGCLHHPPSVQDLEPIALSVNVFDVLAEDGTFPEEPIAAAPAVDCPHQAEPGLLLRGIRFVGSIICGMASAAKSAAKGVMKMLWWRR